MEVCEKGIVVIQNSQSEGEGNAHLHTYTRNDLCRLIIYLNIIHNTYLKVYSKLYHIFYIKMDKIVLHSSNT